MAIKRNEKTEPDWWSSDFAKIDKTNLFSADLWKRTINWNLLQEHVKKTEGICQLINQHIYPSRLFTAYIDILEANLYILDDIFYYETGLKETPANKRDWFIQATLYLRFWNMDWYKEMKLIYEGLDRMENHLIKCLKHEPLSEIADEIFENNRFVRSFQVTQEETFDYGYHNLAFSYACDSYHESVTDKNALVDQIVNILRILDNYRRMLFFYVNDFTLSTISFGNLITMFRQSGMGDSYIRPWRRDYEGSRDNLIVKLEKDPKLGPWVNRYTHLREVYIEDTTKQLFCDEYGNIKDMEEALNTDNWICLLTIAAVLQEYDEQHSQPAKKPARKPKAPSPFTEFIIDTPKSEAILKRLHEIIDGKKPKVCALTIIAAVQKGILMQPTYRALSTEFPEIGDRSNYEYYLERKNNYPDDIDSIAKGF